MTKIDFAKKFEKLLKLQILQLQKMEKSELRRLACLSSDTPERAFSIQNECNEVFEYSAVIQEKLDMLLNKFSMDELGAEKKKKIASMETIVRKLAKRNLELNQRCQDVLGTLLSEVSSQLGNIKMGKNVVNSYKPPDLNRPKSISGEI